MTYRALADSLHDIADKGIHFLQHQWGINPKSVGIETPIDAEFEYTPTLSCTIKDHYHICVDVSERVYNNTLDQFVLDCISRNMPVALYVMIPAGSVDPEYKKNQVRAKRRGVGIIQINEKGGEIIQRAIPVTLHGLRPIDLKRFPASLRASLSHAEETFRTGNPEKGVGTIFEELEAFTRKLAARLESKSLWTGKKKHNLAKNLPWSNLIEFMRKHVDATSGCPKLTQGLFARIGGCCEYRNQSFHKPKNQKELIERDTSLRTRFELGVDIFAELIDATKYLRIN